MSLAAPLSGKIDILRDRAAMLARARSFFSARDVVEVDCPILSRYAAIDTHIDLIPATYHGVDRCYLHSSPEYGMKRLLASGIGDIYQLSHVFRDGEWGDKHNPEFMMAEWYRMAFSFEKMMEETVDFIRLFVGEIPFTIITYRQAFLKYAGIDYLTVTEGELIARLKVHGVEVEQEMAERGQETLLNLILGVLVEPRLGDKNLTVLAHYPASQAALAKTIVKEDGEAVAERFEVYYCGMELANGYHELAEAQEQCRRLQKANLERQQIGKEALPIDEHFLKALEHGLPDCCGVAVGFDRLMMLRRNIDKIADVMPMGWHEA